MFKKILQSLKSHKANRDRYVVGWKLSPEKVYVMCFTSDISKAEEAAVDHIEMLIQSKKSDDLTRTMIETSFIFNLDTQLEVTTKRVELHRQVGLDNIEYLRTT